MQKFLLTVLSIVSLMIKVSAQNPVGDKTTVLDSTAIMQDLMSLLDSTDNPTSYALVSIGIGNRLFSLHNNQLNAKQATTTIVYNPAIGYFHKSGFSLSAGASLLNDAKKGFGTTQYSITPSFELQDNNNWGFGISYSHYFIKDKYSSYASPVQNDIYTYVTYKKTWIEPGLALGFSSGNFTEIFKGKSQNGNEVIDTGTYKIKSFSMLVSASHSFDGHNIFNKKDGITFTPSLQLNFSSDSTQTVSHTISPNFVRLIKRIRRLPKLQGKNSFEAQSVGLNLELNYAIGNFSILPQVYFDYYLPATVEKRFTQVFILSVGYSF